MILTDYYRFDKLPELKSKLRLNCTASTASYNPLERLRNKQSCLFIYLGENTYTKAGKDGKAYLAITHGDTHISSVFMPDFEIAAGVGDMIHTSDALIFKLSNFALVNGNPREGSVLEMFVARGQSHKQNCLYNLLFDGELEQEMQRLREAAKPEQLLK